MFLHFDNYNLILDVDTVSIYTNDKLVLEYETIYSTEQELIAEASNKLGCDINIAQPPLTTIELSPSRITTFINSRKNYFKRYILGDEIETTAAMEIGKLIHLGVLEPTKFNNIYYTGTAVKDPATSQAKVKYQNILVAKDNPIFFNGTKRQLEYKQLAANYPDTILLPSKEKNDFLNFAGEYIAYKKYLRELNTKTALPQPTQVLPAIRNLQADKILSRLLTTCETEKKVTCEIPVTQIFEDYELPKDLKATDNLKFKGIIDFIDIGGGFFGDLKTTSTNLTLHSLKYTMYSYSIQVYIYSMCFKKLNPNLNKIYFTFYSKLDKSVRTVEVSDYITTGKEKLREALTDLLEYNKNPCDGYTEIETLYV